MQCGPEKPQSHITPTECSSEVHKEWWHNKSTTWKWNAFDFRLTIHVIKENPKWTHPMQVIISKIKESHFHYLNRDSCLLPTSPEWSKKKKKHFINPCSLWICFHWTLYINTLALFLWKHVYWWCSYLVVTFL